MKQWSGRCASSIMEKKSNDGVSWLSQRHSADKGWPWSLPVPTRRHRKESTKRRGKERYDASEFLAGVMSGRRPRLGKQGVWKPRVMMRLRFQPVLQLGLPLLFFLLRSHEKKIQHCKKCCIN